MVENWASALFSGYSYFLDIWASMIVIELILIKKVCGAIPQPLLLWTTVLRHWCPWEGSFSIHRIFVNTMIFHLIVTLKTYVGKILHIDSITSTHPNMHRQRHVGRYTRVHASMLRLKKGNLGKPFDTRNLNTFLTFHPISPKRKLSPLASPSNGM